MQSSQLIAAVCVRKQKKEEQKQTVEGKVWCVHSAVPMELSYARASPNVHPEYQM